MVIDLVSWMMPTYEIKEFLVVKFYKIIKMSKTRNIVKNVNLKSRMSILKSDFYGIKQIMKDYCRT